MYHVLHVSASDLYGGAARASYRIYRSLVNYGPNHGIDVKLRVNGAIGSDSSVQSGPPQGFPPQWLRLRLFLNRIYRARFRPANPTLHSTAWLPSGFCHELNSTVPCSDLIHLHWLGDWMLSIEEIGALSPPVVWTMHDQWAFLGAEHYTNFAAPDEPLTNIHRYKSGYHSGSRPSFESGPDVNRRTWLRKNRSWKKPMDIICTSGWMAECARESALMSKWRITVIPYPLNLDVWRPIPKAIARQILGIENIGPLLLFGATGGTADPRKGADLLFEALRILRPNVMGTPLENLQLIIFGQSKPSNVTDVGFPIQYVGTLRDDLSLRAHYSAADLMVVPSRKEAYGQTASEAHACGTPVVGFRTGGLIDIVDDQVTGVLAEPFSASSLASAIHSLLLDPQRLEALGMNARSRAERLWHPSRIAGLHADLYHTILSEAIKQ
jgi:glycosyltransferase involved in cell wall biosynthesis